MNADTEIRSSAINGKGVFAKRNFKSGEIVIEWDTSDLISKETANKATEVEKKYYFAFNDNSYIIMKAPAKFVNHSCSNNTIVQNFCDVAIRDIKKDEEITSNYFQYDNDISFKCTCGSVNCKHK